MQITLDLAILGTILGVILSTAAVARMLFAPLKKIQRQYNAVSEGLVVILHFRLTRECLCIQRKGCMTLGQKLDLDDIYAAYEKLGGNGSGRHMYLETIKLPVCDGE